LIILIILGHNVLTFRRPWSPLWEPQIPHYVRGYKTHVVSSQTGCLHVDKSLLYLKHSCKCCRGRSVLLHCTRCGKESIGNYFMLRMFPLELASDLSHLTWWFCLQDIVENEDIKLDMMFMASLVHDLVKVSRPIQQIPTSRRQTLLWLVEGSVFCYLLHKAYTIKLLCKIYLRSNEFKL
jgi:hypothetical protein